MEMENTQTNQLVKWLEEERRKDKAQLATLQERLAGQANELAEQTRRIQELENALKVTQTAVTKLQQFDQVLAEFKTDLMSVVDRRDEDRKKVEREAERIHTLEVESMQRQLAELKKDLSHVPKFSEDLTARRAEEKRLNDAIQQLHTQVEAASQLVDQSSRAVTYLEEGRRQDTRRIAATEQEIVNLMKKIDSLTGKMQVLEDAHGKLLLKIEAVNPRLAEQDKVLEEIKVSKFQAEQQLKGWADELETFRSQMTNYTDIVSRLREQALVNQRAQSDLQAFQESLRQRVAELAEVERLFEERVKRQTEEAQTESEKRWGKQLTHWNEQWHEHERVHRVADQRLTGVEGVREPLQVAIDNLREDYEKLVQTLFEAVTGMVEAKRHGLPPAAVPPAQTPDDGSGIPHTRPSGKSS
jgi:chromosome segregation ATPase